MAEARAVTTGIKSSCFFYMLLFIIRSLSGGVLVINRVINVARCGWRKTWRSECRRSRSSIWCFSYRLVRLFGCQTGGVGGASCKLSLAHSTMWSRGVWIAVTARFVLKNISDKNSFLIIYPNAAGGVFSFQTSQTWSVHEEWWEQTYVWSLLRFPIAF